MRLLSLIAVLAGVLVGQPAGAAPGQWEQPAAALADQIAGILGPGQARLTIRNVSTISVDEIPAIRRLLEQDLKTHGVLASGAESANTIRVTLSENVRERLWVAEVIQGNETRVAMVHVDAEAKALSPAESGMVLRKERFLSGPELSWPKQLMPDEPVLAMIETDHGLVVLKQDTIFIFGMTATGWKEQKAFGLGQRRSMARDPRGMLLLSPDASGFTAFTGGSECTGNYVPPANQSVRLEDGWSAHCHESDDPWPILQIPPGDGSGDSPTSIKAFYNAARNYFTGVVTPSLGVDLPAFYSAALLPRPGGAALLFNGIDGKVQLTENGALKPVSGTRDWGSDFAALHTGCGGGTQIVASGSGEAASDSLRAYELPAQEAVPVSAPLTMDGTVTALWAAPDGKSILAVVRGPGNEYEVDRVTALCN